ncbi:hypothetical protein Dimus_009505 [Dionaea muscipula]
MPETHRRRRRRRRSQHQQEQQREERSRRIRTKASKLSLEKYLSFINSPSTDSLTVPELNQIISMHGFKKIKAKKVILVEALNAIDHLADPSRSTLRDSISSLAFTQLDDVITDLTDLNWQECSITSMKTLNSAAGYGQSTTTATTSEVIPPRGTKRMQTTAGSGGGGAGYVPIGTPSCSTSVPGGHPRNQTEMKQWKMEKLQDVGDCNMGRTVGRDCGDGSEKKAILLALGL